MKKRHQKPVKKKETFFLKNVFSFFLTAFPCAVLKKQYKWFNNEKFKKSQLELFNNEIVLTNENTEIGQSSSQIESVRRSKTEPTSVSRFLNQSQKDDFSSTNRSLEGKSEPIPRRYTEPISVSAFLQNKFDKWLPPARCIASNSADLVYALTKGCQYYQKVYSEKNQGRRKKITSLTSYKFWLFMKENYKLDQRLERIFKELNGDERSFRRLSRELFFLEFTSRFKGKFLGSYASTHSGAHASDLKLFNFTKENDVQWFFKTLENIFTGDVFEYQLDVDGGFKVTFILPLKIENKKHYNVFGKRANILPVKLVISYLSDEKHKSQNLCYKNVLLKRGKGITFYIHNRELSSDGKESLKNISFDSRPLGYDWESTLNCLNLGSLEYPYTVYEIGLDLTPFDSEKQEFLAKQHPILAKKLEKHKKNLPLLANDANSKKYYKKLRKDHTEWVKANKKEYDRLLDADYGENALILQYLHNLSSTLYFD